MMIHWHWRNFSCTRIKSLHRDIYLYNRYEPKQYRSLESNLLELCIIAVVVLVSLVVPLCRWGWWWAALNRHTYTHELRTFQWPRAICRPVSVHTHTQWERVNEPNWWGRHSPPFLYFFAFALYLSLPLSFFLSLCPSAQAVPAPGAVSEWRRQRPPRQQLYAACSAERAGRQAGSRPAGLPAEPALPAWSQSAGLPRSLYFRSCRASPVRAYEK